MRTRARRCHHQGVTAPSRSAVAVGVILSSTILMFGMVLWLAEAMDRAGRPGLFEIDAETSPLVATVASASVVGAILALRRPRHPVGWLFLALGAAVVGSGVAQGYGLYGAVARPGSLPAAEAVAVVSDGCFIAWFALVMWILHLTPTGSPLTPHWRTIAVASTVAMALWSGTSVVWPGHLGQPFDSLRSPWALSEEADAVLIPLRTVLGAVSGLGFVLGGGSLLVRFHRARGDERRQLLWLAVIVVPLPAFVALAFYASYVEDLMLLSVAVGGFMGLIPVAAGLSIARYHLYDVERILSRAVAWLLASTVLGLTFVTIVVTAGGVVGDRGGSVPAVLATLGAVAVAMPAYRGFQEAIDRRFNRRRFDAIRRVEDFVSDPDPATSVEEVLRQAVVDPTLRVAYWVEDRGAWLSSDGSYPDPAAVHVDVRRQGQPVALVTYDPTVVGADLIEAVCREATPELENAMLRARISVQLEEVRASRTRIAAAHVHERRRLERNLHDGAQQRLLAVALELRAAQVNGTPERLSESVAAAIDDLQAAVLDLRELASGLHPAVLLRGGLSAAVEDLASRFPVKVNLHGLDGRRFPDETEAAAWFIACEGIANAVKHAAAESISLDVEARERTLIVRVIDDGAGRADAHGRGLRGLGDRTEALGGTLIVRSGADGTTLIGVLPCE